MPYHFEKIDSGIGSKLDEVLSQLLMRNPCEGSAHTEMSYIEKTKLTETYAKRLVNVYHQAFVDRAQTVSFPRGDGSKA